MSRIGKDRKIENSWVVPGAWRKEEQGVTANRYSVSFCSDENVLELEVVAQPCDYTKNH